jgi:hypothetical protein
MWWETYERLCKKASEAEKVVAEGIGSFAQRVLGSS